MAEKLYTPELLELATALADFPLTGDFDYRAQGRSRTCGSTIEVGVDLDPDGVLTRIGLQVNACAIGQSSAAILALNAKGRTANDFRRTLKAIEEWLSGDGSSQENLPNWLGFEALAPAHPHKGRHGALLLAWTAINQALSSAPSSR
ncbi:iron-sulfur cluster assembly scaffold protein [Erythrobacter sp. SCSIO 43205]|uniref:iron-sulfur cluster assembly scaffold protein n=1 Tax=Erythrobacter sp. SCSIO 43205 TaxID=2779361 RepID=UPI001CA8FB46|nr:iron-sulfur cluster assembly scaffold protein [Erythrobacter sp. SCSIO 43205]UAB77155.1 iron-sulfur cluster assembly scaffold protein [Erythrobacter sp. SCSIO 43205]